MDWSMEELNASVVAYMEMKGLERLGERFVKKRFYEDLHEKYGRSIKAYEYRMQNISYVYSEMGRSWVKGLRPAKNVGSNVLPIIEKLIMDNESSHSVPKLEFEEKVSTLRRNKSLEKPSGNVKPSKSTKETTTYQRDPHVVAWILNNSQGVCESCNETAPFEKVNGEFYLEVHHIQRLADGGSDTINNAIAVCPNCHKNLHYGKDRELIVERLYNDIQRLSRG